MDKIYAQVLVDRIRYLCKKHDMSINMLATMSGVSESTIDSLVNGKSFNPRMMTIHKVALGFGMTVAEFLDYPELNEYEFDE